ncbi:MAG: type III pantothenate kinase [Campylobacterota bacterium]|nr:type III pantothenate kinase [Campylobacterota bacterium]
MILCDIGNTSYYFLDGDDDYKKDVNSFNPSSLKEEIYYICVNPQVKIVLESLENWIDLTQKVNMTNYYKTMGIDRIFACEAITNGVVIDAGSAITVDVVRDGVFEGGFIYPGKKAMAKSYKNISSALDYEFNFSLNLNRLPKNSQDSISYGYLKLLYNEVISYNMPIYLTGGDSKEFKKIFPNAELDELLLFKGMKKVLEL